MNSAMRCQLDVTRAAASAACAARIAMVCCVAALSFMISGCNHPADTLTPISEGVAKGTSDVDGGVLSDIVNAGPTTIQPGDEIAISVLQDERLNGTYRIDNDGGFQWYYVGRVKTDSLTPSDLRRKLTDAVSKFLNEPAVTVNWVSQEPPTIRILGESETQGLLSLKRGWRLMDAIAAAGGPTDDANVKEIMLIRSVSPSEIRAGLFNYREATLNPLGGEWKNNITLEAGDTIFIPKSGRAQWLAAIEFVDRLADAVVGTERAIVLYPDVESVITTGETEGRNTIVVPGGKMGFAMELILTPILREMMAEGV